MLNSILGPTLHPFKTGTYRDLSFHCLASFTVEKVKSAHKREVFRCPGNEKRKALGFPFGI